jgi:hypothetical protein
MPTPEASTWPTTCVTGTCISTAGLGRLPGGAGGERGDGAKLPQELLVGQQQHRRAVGHEQRGVEGERRRRAGGAPTLAHARARRTSVALPPLLCSSSSGGSSARSYGLAGAEAAPSRVTRTRL